MSETLNDEENAEKADEKEPRVGCLASLIPVTTPGCSSLLTFVFLIFTVAGVWLYFWLDPDSIPWRHSYSFFRIVAVLALVCILPWLVYKVVFLWTEGSPKLYPELDAAWKAGLHALDANELSIHSVPLFLVLGSNSDVQEKAIMNATGLRFSVEGVPKGPAPIHWYANSEAIYLFCTETSWTSALASLREELNAAARAEGIEIESPSLQYIDIDLDAVRRAESTNSFSGNDPYAAPQTMHNGSGFPPSFENQNYSTNVKSFSVPSAGDQNTNSLAQNVTPPQPRLRGTLELTDFIDPKAPTPQRNSPPKTPAQPPSYRGTLMLDGAGGDAMNPLASTGPIDPVPSETDALTTGLGRGQPSYRATSFRNVDVPSSATVPASNYVNPVAFRQDSNVLHKNRKQVLVSHQYSAACLQELSYLCQLISKIRQPLCPVNGVLSLLQYESIHSTTAEADELKKAIRADMETVHASLSLKSPITTLVVGLEKERGFCELVRRVGRDRALSQRFGRRYDVLTVPTKSDLLAFTTLACGTFEDWAYTLFREPEALSKPGNTRLYELLSKVRCAWKGKLADIIAGGYAPDQSVSSNSPFYSGCYFAATGILPIGKLLFVGS